MKIASRILSLLILLAVMTFYVSCRKDDPDKLTEEETQLNKLKGEWTLVTAHDGQDRTTDFITSSTDTPPNAPLKLSVTGNYVAGGTYNYEFTGRRPDPSPWPADGIWKFGTDKGAEIIRDPGGDSEILMTYQVTDSDLIINFDIPDGSAGWEGGLSRVKSVTGHWTFTFNR